MESLTVTDRFLVPEFPSLIEASKTEIPSAVVPPGLASWISLFFALASSSLLRAASALALSSGGKPIASMPSRFWLSIEHSKPLSAWRLAIRPLPEGRNS